MGSEKTDKKQARIRPAGIVCLWQYDETANKWQLMETFGVCDSGHAVTETKLGGNHRYPYTKFMNRYEPDDEDEEDPIAVDGRLVTMWDWTHGVRAIEFNAPTYPKWISGFFWSEMRKEHDFLHLLDGGYEIILQSAAAAEKLLESLRT